MIRRLTVVRPSLDGHSPAATPRPVRLLAVSDEVERAFDFESNRDALRPVDAIVGAGDLEPEYLDFLANTFSVPLLHVLGNHDRGGGWEEGRHRVPDPMDGAWHDVAGLRFAGLSWPTDKKERAIHDDNAAWRQVAAGYLRMRGRKPDVLVSHVPPLGIGDTPEDHYHRGFAAYRWVMERLNPVLWVHGHTAPAAVDRWWTRHRATTVVNATGAVLIEVAVATDDHEPHGDDAPAVAAKADEAEAVKAAP